MYDVKLADENDPLNIRSVNGLNLREFARVINDLSDNPSGFYNSDELLSNFIKDSDNISRNAKIYRLVAKLASNLANEHNEDYENLLNMLIVLRDYLNDHYAN